MVHDRNKRSSFIGHPRPRNDVSHSPTALRFLGAPAFHIFRFFGSSALPLFVLFSTLLFCTTATADIQTDILSLLEKNDACILLSPTGEELVSVHGDRLLVPASTLKVLTALVGFHYLGEEYRFPTEIYFNAAGDLSLRGYGDPLLISEVFPDIVREIKSHLPGDETAVRDLILDDTFFTFPLTVPGVSVSDQPYDAANGALCANFNTIAFKRKTDGGYTSAEEQTPLLPSVVDRIRQTGQDEGRISLAHSREEITGYTGGLLAHFLGEESLPVTGAVRLAGEPPPHDDLIFTYPSPYTLSEAVSKLLAFSNNFMANQIFIAAGAHAFGAPGDLEKGVLAAGAYASSELGLGGFTLVEGSGISRKNRISARMMLKILEAFTPHRELLRRADHEYYKTGTLKGISTRTGYLTDDGGGIYPFVVMLNDSPGNMEKVMEGLKRMVGE